MQSGLGQPAAGARQAGIIGAAGGIGVLLLGLAASACVNAGQIGNLTERPHGTRRLRVDRRAAVRRLPQARARASSEEAGARQIAVVPRERRPTTGCAAISPRMAEGRRSHESIAWVWDVYDADQRRALRLSGEEKAAPAAPGRRPTMRSCAGSPAPACSSLPSWPPRRQPRLPRRAPPRAQRAAPMFGWLDDWAPEASGIFRVFRREPAKPEIAADAGPLLPPDEVPLPRGRPAPSGARVRPGVRLRAGRPVTRHRQRQNLRDKNPFDTAARIASLAASLLSGRRGARQGIARRQRCGPITERSSSSPATPIPRSPTRSPPISTTPLTKAWCGASPTWRSSSRSRRTCAAPTSSSSSRRRIRPTTT